MMNPDKFSKRVVETPTETERTERKRIETYGRFLNLASIDGTSDEAWGEMWQNWLSGKLKDNIAPGLETPPEGFKEFIEGKGYSFETGEKLQESA